MEAGEIVVVHVSIFVIPMLDTTDNEMLRLMLQKYDLLVWTCINRR